MTVSKSLYYKVKGTKAFCAGASFDELLTVTTLEEGKTIFFRICNTDQFNEKMLKTDHWACSRKICWRWCWYCWQPVIIVFATEASDIKLSELSIGIGPFVIAPALERKMGISCLK